MAGAWTLFRPSVTESDAEPRTSSPAGVATLMLDVGAGIWHQVAGWHTTHKQPSEQRGQRQLKTAEDQLRCEMLS
jgi:hypothetical protein